MTRKPTPAQQATYTYLADRTDVAHVRVAWDGKVMLLGISMKRAADEASCVRMYRISPDGTAVGV